MNIYEILFSPTGGTQKVADIFAAAFHQEVEVVDLTDSSYDFSAVSIEEDDVCIIAAPSYAGRVPALAARRLSLIRGNHARAVLIAVYGNREFEDTLTELKDLSEASGFLTVAGVSAVAEHSLIHRFGAGRPDSRDLSELNGFAEKVAKEIHSGKRSAVTVPGNRPYKDAHPSSIVPLADDSCTGCRLCAWNCPAEAIPEDHPEQTNASLCISCMRCVTICPHHARKLPDEQLHALEQKLEPLCSERKANALYL